MRERKASKQAIIKGENWTHGFFFFCGSSTTTKRSVCVMCDGLLMPVYYTDEGVVPIEREREREKDEKSKTRQSRSSSFDPTDENTIPGPVQYNVPPKNIQPNAALRIILVQIERDRERECVCVRKTEKGTL